MVLIVGSVIFASSLGLPLIMEGIIYGTPSEVSSAPDGATGSFVGTIKKVGRGYLEIEGFDGIVECNSAGCRIGEKVIITGVLLRWGGLNVVVGEIPPGVVIMDGSLPAEITRPWWPLVSEMMMIAGIAIIPTGMAGMSFSRWERGLTGVSDPQREPGSS
jgi:hypothetical protein